MKTWFKKRLREGAVSVLNHMFRRGSLRMVLVCGHMRSGSSLLMHILNTHPRIVGYGETHTVYLSEEDFGRAAFAVFRSFARLPSRECLVADKVLFTRLLEDPAVLDKTHVVFLIRKPGPALSSLYRQGIHLFDHPSEIADYYRERLRWIGEMSTRLEPGRWTWATYEELVRQPDRVFGRIEQLLDLRQGLGAEYDTTWATGRRGIGDNSRLIRAGRIIADDPAPVADEIKDFLPECGPAFEVCRRALSRGRKDKPDDV